MKAWLLVLAALGGSPAPWNWGTGSPESHGLSREKLEALKESLRAHRTHGVLVVRNDQIVLESYAEGYSRTKPHGTASMAKAIVAGLSLGVAMDDGRIGLDDPASKFIPAWAADPRKSRILVRQLGSHTSGLADAHEDKVPHEKLTGWKGDFWKRLPPPQDPFTISRDATPVLFDPGTSFQYSNPGIAMLTAAVTAALRDSECPDIRTLLRERVLRRIGVPAEEWSCGYGQTVEVDGLPLVGSWGGGSYSPDAMARIGRLMLRHGDWEGAEVLKSSSVRAVTSDAGLPGSLGQGWWTNAGKRVASLPTDAYWGSGAGHQLLLVVPSLNLIAVRVGEELDPAMDHEDAARKYFFDPLLEAVLVKPPVPPSPVIRGIQWAPASTVTRRATDSDTWPLTWADDDAMYTAFGDGTGFDPSSPKLSMGVARIDGTPREPDGKNLHTSADDKGDGGKGKKACGMLMVDGTLYMWVRNIDGKGNHSRLAWSADHGVTWDWSSWVFEEFGYPTFINFGKNYAGARDGYVYVVSHDGPSAYKAADRFVLMRAAKDKVRSREGYEFFKGVDSGGQPAWSASIGDRTAVLTFPGRCRRSAITYDAGLKRYLWWQMIHEEGVDHRFKGGFGIYDAPEPWGPWTVAHFATRWDMGPGETASFPTKWMSPDGRSLHLVFSADDSFAVRAATIIPR